jgi:hypothetical protein
MVYGSCDETQGRSRVRLGLAIFCLLACHAIAAAQSGVSTQRDANGNLIRDNGGYSAKAVNQGPVNNGPIKNSATQPSNANIGPVKGASK